MEYELRYLSTKMISTYEWAIKHQKMTSSCKYFQENVLVTPKTSQLVKKKYASKM